jgi:hypothetical protein
LELRVQHIRLRVDTDIHCYWYRHRDRRGILYLGEMMEYKIVESNNITALTEIINGLLNKGWVCQGGVSRDGWWLYQAVVREKSNE